MVHLRPQAPVPPCLGRAPSRRLPQVEAAIRRGLFYTEIAREPGVRKSTAAGHALRLFKQHRVRSKAELLRKLGLDKDVGEAVKR